MVEATWHIGDQVQGKPLNVWLKCRSIGDIADG
jgi:hypothetical protein